MGNGRSLPKGLDRVDQAVMDRIDVSFPVNAEQFAAIAVELQERLDVGLVRVHQSENHFGLVFV